MPVTSSFFICTTPRSGSSLLSEALEFTGSPGGRGSTSSRNTKRIGLLAWASRRNAEYFEKFLAAGTTPNGVFGAKVTLASVRASQGEAPAIQGEGASDLELLRRTFPDLRYIFLTRRDKVAQAVSYFKAIRTDSGTSMTPDAQPDPGNCRRSRLHSTSSRSIAGSRASRRTKRAGAATSR